MRALMIGEDVPSGELRRLAKAEADPRVARRLLAIAVVLEGMSREAAARIAGMNRQTLRNGLIRYNRGEPAGRSDRWSDGRPCLLTEEQQATLKAFVLQGPYPEVNGVSTWRLVDLCRIVRGRFGMTYSETRMGRLVRALGLSWQTPRPRHAETNRAAQEAFTNKKVLCRSPYANRSDHPEAERIEVWFQDEARVGQKGRMVRRWLPPVTDAGENLIVIHRSGEPRAGVWTPRNFSAHGRGHGSFDVTRVMHPKPRLGGYPPRPEPSSRTLGCNLAERQAR